MKALRRFFNILSSVEEWSGIILLFSITATIVLQVFSRYILNNPVVWTEELSRFLFIWLIMLQVGHSVRTKGHIRIDAVVGLLPQAAQTALHVAMNLLGLVVFAGLTPYFLKYAISQNAILSTGLRLPYSVIYGSVLVGSILLILHLIEDLINIFAKEEGSAL